MNEKIYRGYTTNSYGGSVKVELYAFTDHDHYVFHAVVYVDSDEVLNSRMAYPIATNEYNHDAAIRHAANLHQFLVKVHPADLELGAFNNGRFDVDLSWIEKRNAADTFPFSLTGLRIQIELVENFPIDGQVIDDEGEILEFLPDEAQQPIMIGSQHVKKIIEQPDTGDELVTTISFSIRGELIKAAYLEGYEGHEHFGLYNALMHDIGLIAEQEEVDPWRVRMNLHYGASPDDVMRRFGNKAKSQDTAIGFYYGEKLIGVSTWGLHQMHEGFALDALHRVLTKSAHDAAVEPSEIRLRFFRNMTAEALAEQIKE